MRKVSEEVENSKDMEKRMRGLISTPVEANKSRYVEPRMKNKFNKISRWCWRTYYKGL
jgi:hypothetical protein